MIGKQRVQNLELGFNRHSRSHLRSVGSYRREVRHAVHDLDFLVDGVEQARKRACIGLQQVGHLARRSVVSFHILRFWLNLYSRFYVSKKDMFGYRIT